MAVTHPTAVRTALADFVVDQLDLNTPPGKIIMQTAGGTTVSTLTFANPAFGAASSGTATANAIVADTNAVGGTIAKAEPAQQRGDLGRPAGLADEPDLRCASLMRPD